MHFVRRYILQSEGMLLCKAAYIPKHCTKIGDRLVRTVGCANNNFALCQHICKGNVWK